MLFGRVIQRAEWVAAAVDASEVESPQLPAAVGAEPLGEETPLVEVAFEVALRSLRPEEAV